MYNETAQIILVVDDNFSRRSITAQTIRTAGYNVLEGATAHECLLLVRETEPALLLLGESMPDASSLEVCQQIKADQELARSRVVLLLGVKPKTNTPTGNLKTGADDQINYPISNGELLARIAAAL